MKLRKRVATQKLSLGKRRFWTSMRIVLFSGTVILVVAVAAIFYPQRMKQAGMSDILSGQTRPASPEQGQAPPPAAHASALPPGLLPLPPILKNAEMRGLDGKPIRLSGFGGKVLVLDVWASWCAPCRVEIPHLLALRKEYAARGVEFLGLTIEDPAKDADKVHAFAREFKIDYRLGWASGDIVKYLMEGNTTIPQTFILTRDQRLLKRFIGFSMERYPPMMREAIELAIAG